MQLVVQISTQGVQEKERKEGTEKGKETKRQRDRATERQRDRGRWIHVQNVHPAIHADREANGPTDTERERERVPGEGARERGNPKSGESR